MGFSFIHAADIHLDSPLRGLEKYDSAPVEDMRNATRRAFENLVNLAISEEVAFVLIAGDLYDGDWEDWNTGLFMVGEFTRLKEKQIPVFVVSGNHDAQNKMTKQLPMPENVTFFSADHPESVTLDSSSVAIHGQSYASMSVEKDLSLNYPVPSSGYFNIGLLHTSAAGYANHETYAPCSVEYLKEKGYDYWALGHIHKREILHESDPVIAFSGNLQGRHIRETGPKGCLLVHVDHDHSIEVEFQSLDVFRWDAIQADGSAVESLVEFEPIILQEVEMMVGSVGSLPLALRIILQGCLEVKKEWHRRREFFLQEIRSRLIEHHRNQVWLEKIVWQTTTSSPSETLPPGDHTLSEILAVLEKAEHDSNLHHELKESLLPIERVTPPEIWKELGLHEGNIPPALFQEVKDLLLLRLVDPQNTD